MHDSFYLYPLLCMTPFIHIFFVVLIFSFVIRNLANHLSHSLQDLSKLCGLLNAINFYTEHFKFVLMFRLYLYIIYFLNVSATNMSVQSN